MWSPVEYIHADHACFVLQTAAAAAAAAGWGAQWRWTPQSPPVVSGSQYMYPMQSPTGFSHEMLYASQGQYASDMAAAAAADSSMLEAAQAAEVNNTISLDAPL